MKELRYNPTNSANDSKGHSLGLEGDQFLYVIAALVLGIALGTGGLKGGMAPETALLIGAMPLPLSIAFLIFFKIGKPPAYLQDVIQKHFGNCDLCREESSAIRPMEREDEL